MQNARTPHRFIRSAAAGIAGVAALLAPLAGSAGAELSTSRDVVTPIGPLVGKAGTVSSQNGILILDAATNSHNDIWLVGDGGFGGHLVADHNAALNPGAGCFVMKDVFVKPVIRCAPAVHIVVRLGSGNDEAFVSAGPPITTDVDAGSGNDTVRTETSSDHITGGYGADSINAGGGDDVLIGGSDGGFDSLNGGAGGDDCHQGESYMNCDNGVVNDNAVR